MIITRASSNIPVVAALVVVFKLNLSAGESCCPLYVLKYVNLIIHLHIAIVLINNMSGFNEYIKTGYINLHYKIFFSILTTKYDKNPYLSAILYHVYLYTNIL